MARSRTDRRNDEPETLWHALPEEELLSRLETDDRGLSSGEAEERLRRYGPNELAADEGVSLAKLVLRQLSSPLIYILIGAAALSFLSRHYVEAVVIAVIVALNTLLGVVQEYRAENALEAIRKMASPHARVIRGGREREIDAAEVVPGDIVVLETGDRVPADGRVRSAKEFEVNEAGLTGESEPVRKAAGLLDEDRPLTDRTNMVYMSTTVTGGRARAAVTATGMRTMMGGIAGKVRSTGREQTPLQRRLGKLANILGAAGIGFAVILFLIGLARGYDTIEMALYAVSVAVSAIPEGLPAAISVTLAFGVRRMAKRNAIIRRLPAVETLGSTTVICSDKTGTITRGEMTVTRIYADGTPFDLEGQGYRPEGRIVPAMDAETGNGARPDAGSTGADLTESGREELDASGSSGLGRLLEIGAAANNAELYEREGTWSVKGSPTEGAILVASRKGGPGAELRSAWERLDELPFSSDRQYMAVLVRRGPGGHDSGSGGKAGGNAGSESRPVLMVKGAPDRVLGFCSQVLEHGGTVELDPERRSALEEANRRLAEEGLRVLAGAYREEPGGTAGIRERDAEHDLVFAGLWGIEDPARPDAIEAIREAKEAGITVLMLTGDHATTAAAIARQVGIGTGERTAVTGSELESMDRETLAKRLDRDRVFARVTPAHKLRILEALQRRGETVAMTGDGVNDAPALKTSNIGVAMGRTGTEVAKEAADMVLTDDDFATIVHAVEEGRLIFGNLRRAIFYLVTTNLGEVLVLMAALLLGFPLPLAAVMILWINLVTDGVCVVPLGLEPKHRNVLADPPLPPGTGVLDAPLARRLFLLAPLMAAGTLGLFARVLASDDIEHARSAAFVTLAAFQWFHALNARSRYRSIFSIGPLSNRLLVLGIGLAVILQVLAVQTPVGHFIFGTVNLTAGQWALSILVASSILAADEILKLFGVHGRDPERSGK